MLSEWRLIHAVTKAALDLNVAGEFTRQCSLPLLISEAKESLHYDILLQGFIETVLYKILLEVTKALQELGNFAVYYDHFGTG